MPLRFNMRKGACLLVNGAVIHFLVQNDIQFLNQVDFVHSKQFMPQEVAQNGTDIHKLYYDCQQAYAGGEEASERLCEWLANGWTGPITGLSFAQLDFLADARAAALTDRWYDTLKALAAAIGTQWEWRIKS